MSKTKEEIAIDVSKTLRSEARTAYHAAIQAITEWEAQKWQDIKTCPEYKKVLMIDSVDNIRVVIIGVLTDDGIFDDDGNKTINVIFWQPLPTPPECGAI